MVGAFTTKKVFFLQCNWDNSCAHDVFLTELDLYCNVFSHTSKKYKTLAITDTWLKNFRSLETKTSVGVDRFFINVISTDGEFKMTFT